MRLDRHVLDFLNWLRNLLSYRAGQDQQKPFDKVGTAIRGSHGLLQEIKRYFPAGVPDRDVAAWVFYPFRYQAKKEDVHDTYIFCLKLGTTAARGEKIPVGKVELKKGSRRRRSDPTHRLEICRGSHWLTKDNRFNATEIFAGDYDLQGDSQFAHQHAIELTKRLSYNLKHRKPEEMNWGFEIEQLRKEVMGVDYTYPPGTVHQRVDFINLSKPMEAVDGDRPSPPPPATPSTKPSTSKSQSQKRKVS
jgi:hypothetical protein